MSRSEKAKLELYTAILSYLNENRNVTCNIRAFMWSISKFRKLTEEIRCKQMELSSESLEKSLQVSKAKDDLILLLLPVITSLHNYAKETKDVQLKSTTRVTYSQIVRIQDRELIEKTLMITRLAEKYMTRMRRQEITIHTLQNLRYKAEKFRLLLEDRFFSFISSSALLAMNALFAEADKMLYNFIDNFVESLSEGYPEFHRNYLKIRNFQAREKKAALSE
ncbi:MAG: hypothetical protein ACM3UR_09510 [Bacteroidota bacterium]|jgi:hypothetical protein|nr:hypothetical protein [Ignavibacteria bacterium]MCU7499418.1 hypothetical protein [Ignavibacteria bacterium]MCU7511556.1 hypothetical protein [Ignavibacteria bacterium]MCU7521061.1 hypothetical protein [Ignavibacteria bacterium]MCU7524318.1 hypothetical protein [Ignavibacteria bacterium]